MMPAYGMVFLPQDPGTGDGQAQAVNQFHSAHSLMPRKIWRFRPLCTRFLGRAVMRTRVCACANMHNVEPGSRRNGQLWRGVTKERREERECTSRAWSNCSLNIKLNDRDRYFILAAPCSRLDYTGPWIIPVIPKNIPRDLAM